MKMIRWIGFAAVVGLCLFLDYRILSDAYGQVPPYYGRTVNMDKWTSPAPALLIVNGIALVAVGLLFLPGLLNRRP